MHQQHMVCHEACCNNVCNTCSFCYAGTHFVTNWLSWLVNSSQVEQQALKKEKDPISKSRLQEVQKELAALEDQLRPLLLKYEKEKKRLDEIRRLQQKRQELVVSTGVTA